MRVNISQPQFNVALKSKTNPAIVRDKIYGINADIYLFMYLFIYLFIFGDIAPLCYVPLSTDLRENVF
jgi:hypothetical protein